MDDWEKAGKLTAEALEFGKKLIKKDSKLIDITEKIESQIYKLGGKPAFPVQISLNDVAAHYNAVIDDQIILGEDIVKLDLGVQVNGAIGDTAATIDLTGKNKELIQAAEEALNAATKIAKPGTKLNDIGKTIHEVITSYGFSPIKNLSGHGLSLNEIHDEPTVPNFDNRNKEELTEGQHISIEPFATTGSGFVIEGKKSEIYQLIDVKPVRDLNSRRILLFIAENYGKFPFAKRWLLKEFDKLKINFALTNLERAKILHQYNQLPEKSHGLVAQAEHSLEIGKGILTKL